MSAVHLDVSKKSLTRLVMARCGSYPTISVVLVTIQGCADCFVGFEWPEPHFLLTENSLRGAAGSGTRVRFFSS